MRVEIGPLVSCTGFRNPALLAKAAETLAEILRGHAQLGINHVQTVLDPNTASGVEAFGRVLEVLDHSQE